MPTVYEIINQRILESLEKESTPIWERGWTLSPGVCNALTGRNYSGINVWTANLHMLENNLTARGYIARSRITGPNAEKLPDGNFRYSIAKGAKSLPVVYWLWPTAKDIAEYNAAREKGNPVKRPTPRALYHLVFNIEHVVFHDESEREKLFAKYGTAVSVTGDATVESMLASWENSPTVVFALQNDACYIHALDTILLPTPAQFSSAESLACTELHEIAHSTGHTSRLNREGLGQSFGTVAYAKEELIAELASAYLASIFGIHGTRDTELLDQSAAYIDSWYEVLSKNKNMFVSAAQEAQKVVNFALRNMPEYAEFVSNTGENHEESN